MNFTTRKPRNTRWRRLAVAMSLALLTSFLTTAPSTAAPAPVAWDSVTGAPLAAWDCSRGNVCFWTGSNGTGSRCMWDTADADWTAGAVTCSWATTRVVKSVWNRGEIKRLTGVAYYLKANYVNRVGCTARGDRGNLAGTYYVRSHIWIDTACG
jgi:hypothetical protein